MIAHTVSLLEPGATFPLLWGLINIVDSDKPEWERKIKMDGTNLGERRGQSERVDESAWNDPQHCGKKRDTQTDNPRGQEVHLCTFIHRAWGERSADSFIISSNTDVTLKLNCVPPTAGLITPKPGTKPNHQKGPATDRLKACLQFCWCHFLIKQLL